MKTIKVKRINIDSLNRLIQLGYKVIVTASSDNIEPRKTPKQTVLRPINIKRQRKVRKVNKLTVCHKNHVKEA